MSAVVLDADGQEVEQRRILPRRVRLSHAAIDRLAELCQTESPAAAMVASSSSLDSLGDRLGDVGRPAVGRAEATQAASVHPPVDESGADDAEPGAASDTDVDEALTTAGLVDGEGPTREGRAVLQVWHTPALAVELEMLLSFGRRKVRMRSWHRNLDDWVVCLSTADGRTFELSWLSADDWWLELGRAAYVNTRLLGPVPERDEPLPDVMETPWDLLLATGEAVDRRRPELLETMVGDYSGLTLGGVSLAELSTVADTSVRQWHEQLESTSRGRLHAAVMGRSELGRPGAGIVEWVLFHDGWRSLTPFRRDGWNMVRIERKGPQDLPRELAVRAAELTS